MKVLIITNLFPLKKNPLSGVFVVRRLEQYQKFGVEYLALSPGFLDNLTVRFIKRLLKREFSEPLKKFQNVQFELVLIRQGLMRTIFGKLFDGRGYTKEYLHLIENSIDVLQFDLIHAHGMYHIPAGEIACLLAEKYHKPFVVTLHGSDVNVVMPKRKKRYIQTLEKASKCIFVSKALLEKAKSFGYSGKNAVVIPNGYDPDIFKPMDKEEARKKLGIYKEGYKYVGFVGNLIPIKRSDKLSEIFNFIHTELSKTFFIVVGDGHLRKKIEEETKGLDIIFTGRVPQEKVAEYMNAMDVMILPSRKEGFGAVVIEAQACGTCVIGSSNGGIPEAIGFDEYVVEEGENFEERFAKRVIDVLKNGYDRNRLIERAKNFTWEEVVKREIEIYGQVG